MEFEGDESLVRLVERGGRSGERAVAVLLRRHLPRVYSLCRRYFAAREDAEEAASETMARAFRALAAGQFRGDCRLATWLVRIGGRTCIERLRQPRLPTLSLDDLCDSDLKPRERTSDRAAKVREAMQRLPDDQGLVMTLCDLEGYSAKETAEIVGRSAEATRSLHYRARRAVRDMIFEWDAQDEEWERRDADERAESGRNASRLPTGGRSDRERSRQGING